MTKIFTLIKKDYQAIPSSVKTVTLIISLWLFGWGMVDPLFSLYIKSIVPNYKYIGLAMALFNLTAIFVVIPLGKAEDYINPINILWRSFIIYILVSILYIFAGTYKSIFILILTLILHGFASPMVYVSARTFIKKHAENKNASRIAGLFSMTTYGFYALGMFFSAFFWTFFVKFYTQKTMFLAVTFSCLWCLFMAKKMAKLKQNNWENSLKGGIIRLKKEGHLYKHVFKDFKQYDFRVYYALALIFFIGVVSQLIITFIPLFAFSLNLSLPQISVIMGVMFIPYIFSFLFAEIADRCERIKIASIGLILAAVPMVALYYVTDNVLVALFSAMIALSLALINPAAEGTLTSLIPVDKRGEITWIQSLFYRSGMFLWPLILGFVADAKGINFVFLLVGIFSIFLAIISVLIKMHAHVKWEIHIINKKIHNKPLSHSIIHKY